MVTLTVAEARSARSSGRLVRSDTLGHGMDGCRDDRACRRRLP